MVHQRRAYLEFFSSNGRYGAVSKLQTEAHQKADKRSHIYLMAAYGSIGGVVLFTSKFRPHPGGYVARRNELVTSTPDPDLAVTLSNI